MEAGGVLRHLTDMKEPRAQQETVGKVPQIIALAYCHQPQPTLGEAKEGLGAETPKRKRKL